MAAGLARSDRVKTREAVVSLMPPGKRPGAEQPEPGHPPRAHDAVRVPDWNPNGAASSFALSFAGKRNALEAQGGRFS
jgi:hypothetical protein